MSRTVKGSKKKKQTKFRGKTLSYPPEEVDKLLVHGETVEFEEGKGTHRFPSYAEIAERYKVSVNTISRYSQKHNCLARREQVQKKVEEIADAKLAEYRADKVALGRDDEVRIFDRFIVDFETALREGRVSTNSPSDLCAVVKAKHQVLGENNFQAENEFGVTLDDIQRYHRDLLERSKSFTPEMMGNVTPSARPSDGQAEPEEEQPAAEIDPAPEGRKLH